VELVRHVVAQFQAADPVEAPSKSTRWTPLAGLAGMRKTFFVQPAVRGSHV